MNNVRVATMAVARAVKLHDADAERAARAALAVGRVRRELETARDRGVRLDPDQARDLHTLVDSVLL